MRSARIGLPGAVAAGEDTSEATASRRIVPLRLAIAAVGLDPHAPPGARAFVHAALREMSRDPDPVVADQAKDSLTARFGR